MPEDTKLCFMHEERIAKHEAMLMAHSDDLTEIKDALKELIKFQIGFSAQMKILVVLQPFIVLFMKYLVDHLTKVQ